MKENIFVTLFKFGPGAEENYLTEAFVFLLKLLLERELDAGLAIINQLCGLSQENRFEVLKPSAICTQITVDNKRPDIEIRGDKDTLVYVEVKHDSPLGEGQLESYKTRLQESGASNTQLVLLSRSRASARETTLNPEDYYHVCWYEVYDLFSNATIQDEVCEYFVQNFLRFLESKRMRTKEVTEEYVQGTPVLINLIDMIETAIPEAMPGIQPKKTTGINWKGFYLHADYWCGILYEQPLVVVFQNKKGFRPTYERNINLEEIHFFSLDKGKQFKCLVEFLREASIDT